MELSDEKRGEILGTLKNRFEKNMKRHEGIGWDEVQARLEADNGKLRTLSEMERTGGEPDVVCRDGKTGEFVFFDCSEESPKGRRSLCYDREALESRKENRPESSVMEMAAAMGAELLLGRGIPGIAEKRKIRRQNIELDSNTCRYQKTRRRRTCRFPVRTCLRVSQRRRILLCFQRIPCVAESLI